MRVLTRLSDYHISIDTYRTVRIENIELETHRVKTFTFTDKLCNQAQIGQYIMIWIQGIDEIPISLSAINSGGTSRITVENVGEATAALHSKNYGDSITLRGPYGNWFKLVKGNVLVIGGGVGLAPLRPLLEVLVKIGSKITLIIGAKSQGELLSLNRIKSILEASRGRLIITTEDGSYGMKGFATTPMGSLVAEHSFDAVYTCGPEPMMRRVFEIAENKDIEVQVCSERIIRCSVGLCGSCVIGRFRVCKDGPIFSSKEIREILDEFGVFRREYDGRKVSF